MEYVSNKMCIIGKNGLFLVVNEKINLCQLIDAKIIHIFHFYNKY